MDVKAAAQLFADGKIILHPTDTVIGLGANALIAETADMIDEIKNRPEGKNYIVLMRDEAMANEYCTLNEEVLKWMNEDRPTTVICTCKHPSLQHLVRMPEQSLAIRIPRSGWVKDLFKAIDFPLISTSANLSGAPAVQRLSEVDDQVKEKVDLIIDDQRVEGSAKASRIIRLSESGEVEVIRE